MLVCYLDDSGEDKEPVITLAGMIAPADCWQDFEIDARKCFDHIHLPYLHTVDLHHRRGEFKDWNSTQTAEFATQFMRLVEGYIGFSVEFSVLKSRFEESKSRFRLKSETSPMSMCFRGVLNEIIRDPGFLDAEKMDGVDLSFVVEYGHKNNNDILQHWNAIKKMDPKRFGSLTFEDKKKRIALQAADFIAFYSRRIRNATPEYPRTAELEMFQHVLGNIKHRPFLATDFGA